MAGVGGLVGWWVGGLIKARRSIRVAVGRVGADPAFKLISHSFTLSINRLGERLRPKRLKLYV